MNNAQSKLEAMKSWKPSRLWAATRKYFYQPPKPFVPNLKQHIPAGPTTALTNEGHRAWVFKFPFKPAARGATIAEYVASWNIANNLMGA